MASNANVDWEQIGGAFRAGLIDQLRRRLESGGPFRLTAEQLAVEAMSTAEEAAAFLEALTDTGIVVSEISDVCPCDVQRELPPLEVSEAVCAQCGRAFVDVPPGHPVKRTQYFHEAPVTRDVKWVLALHGMNTRGAWQEEFSWVLSRAYGYSVPVAIYKYGIVRPGAILKFRQRALVAELADRMRHLGQESTGSGFGGRPDVIAHSLGTWLLGHALRENPDLKVGRVILLGCILRPDFDWLSLIERGQVEAVLCHYGTRDFWAGVSHYIIPDSGPSGRRGFCDRKAIIHVEAPGFRHSDFFRKEDIRSKFSTLWTPFLTTAARELGALAGGDPPGKPWRQSSWLLRATFARWLILTLAVVVGVSVVASMIFGMGPTAELWWRIFQGIGQTVGVVGA